MAHQINPNMYHFRGQVDIDTGAKLLAYSSHIGVSISQLIANAIYQDTMIMNYNPPYPILENIKQRLFEANKARRERADAETARGKYRNTAGRVSASSDTHP